ncbi:MAG: hypothetical protein CV087_12330 [Candidatus Brocadia sp. WS118]|nr:MAG: hypothetical protein CV087_12330 [Candidatus Brocadia sp. WS118]
MNIPGKQEKSNMQYLRKYRYGKAQLYFSLIVSINLACFLVIITGAATGIKGYISDTKFVYEAVTCCGSVCSKCFFTLHTIATTLPWICVAILFAGIAATIHRIFCMLSCNYRFVRSLAPLSVDNYPGLKNILLSTHLDDQLVLFDNGVLRHAFTSGLWKPKTYLSTGVCSYLTAKEIQAVILHEAHHVIKKAPLMLFVLRILCTLNFFLPINRYLLNLYSTACEKEADDAVVTNSGEPLELASALLKLSRSYSPAVLYPMIPFSSGQRIVEDRVMRLLEPHAVLPSFGKASSYPLSLLSLLIAVTICFPLYGKFFTPLEKIECKTKVCHMIKCGF